MHRLIRHYREKTGESAVDMHKIAAFAVKEGWPLPKPKSPLDLLASQFSKAARQETKIDAETGNPYRVNHALPSKKGSQGSLWIDIDTATRSQMHTSLTLRREQTVGDMVQLTFDTDHWNAVNPDKQELFMDPDMTFDVELRKAGDDMDDVG